MRCIFLKLRFLVHELPLWDSVEVRVLIREQSKYMQGPRGRRLQMSEEPLYINFHAPFQS
jgi:hypothetical protein